MNYTIDYVKKYFNLNKSTLKRIREYLEIELEKKGKFLIFSQEDFNKIESFLKENPNTRVFFQKQTFLKKYGVENPQQLKSIKEKTNKIIEERYGVKNISQSEEIKEKKIETLQSHYGKDVTNPMKSLKIVDKIKDNWNDKSEDDIKEMTSKIKHTKLEKYGNENYNNKDKISITKSKRNDEEIKLEVEKAKKTKLERYGDENYNNINKIHETKLERYGKKSTTNVEHINKTKLERYGTLVFNHKYLYDNIKFDSSWELYFYIYHKEILNDDICRGKIFEFQFENKTHYYECDFLLNGKNIEIKGSQYLDENKELKFPYTNDERIDSERTQRLWSAKSKCMKDNNVEVLSKDDIEPIVVGVKEIYGDYYINQFRIT